LDYGGWAHQTGGLGLHAAVWLQVKVRGLGCCGLDWPPALPVTTAPEYAANAET